MRGGKGEGNQRGAGGSGQATPPDGCCELGHGEAAGAACVGWAFASALGAGARTLPVADGSGGLATTFGLGFGLGFGLASAASAALASLEAALACLGAALASVEGVSGGAW